MKNWTAAIVVTFVLTCLIVPACWRIASKAGYKPALSLLMVVSPVNLILMALFALKEWPIERELRLLRSSSDR